MIMVLKFKNRLQYITTNLSTPFYLGLEFKPMLGSHKNLRKFITRGSQKTFDI